jgi:hypothetical protein
MAQPWRHPKTGVYWYRRTVPEALRGVVGKREWKRTLNTKDASEAKRKYIAEAARFELAIGQARTRVKAGQSPFTPRGPAALAAEWLRGQLEKHEANTNR